MIKEKPSKVLRTENPKENYLKRELYALIKNDNSIFDFIQEAALDGL